VQIAIPLGNGAEAGAAVEGDGILPGCRGFQHDALVAALAGGGEEGVEKDSTDAVAALFAGHRHAHDAAVAGCFRDEGAGAGEQHRRSRRRGRGPA
jgi:hypothetical protein